MALTRSLGALARDLLPKLGALVRRLFPSARAEPTNFPHWLWAALETLAFCIAALALRLWIDPQDPFGIGAQFPWLWMVPAVLAMRYGTAAGALAVLVLVAGWLLTMTQGQWATVSLADFPQAYFLGGLMLVLICGQFSDVWQARSRRLRAVNAYLDERLNTLTKNHFLLRLSHERLEQDLLAKPLTLRETLVRLRNLSSATPLSAENPMPGAAEFLQVLGQSCQLECAALHCADQGSMPQPLPVAILGAPVALDIDDPLLQYCLEQKIMAHVQTASLDEERRDASRYLVCAPLLAANGESCGVLVVEKMPFFALNDDTLQLLSVLIGYYADGLCFAQLAREVLQAVPDCPPELALDLVRLHRIRHDAGIESSLVALVFEQTPQALAAFEQIKRLKRGVDLVWEIAGERRCALITLLPLASSAAVEGYLLRIESAVQSQFGANLLSSRIASHTVQLGASPPADTLRELVTHCAS